MAPVNVSNRKKRMPCGTHPARRPGELDVLHAGQGDLSALPARSENQPVGMEDEFTLSLPPKESASERGHNSGVVKRPRAILIGTASPPAEPGTACVDPTTVSTCVRTSPALCWRRSRSFSSACRTIASTRGSARGFRRRRREFADRQLAGEQFVKDHAERIDVRAVIHVLAAARAARAPCSAACRAHSRPASAQDSRCRWAHRSRLARRHRRAFCRCRSRPASRGPWHRAGCSPA